MFKVFCLNSLKSRVNNLNIILPNILKQCDVLHINTIGYNLDKNEIISKNKEKIILHHFDSLGSEGRLLYYNDYDENTYYFTIDDDIFYPENYSNKLVDFLNVNQKSIVCVHGSNLKNINENDYRLRDVIHFKSKLEKSSLVQFPGVGTSCFKKNVININQSDFKIKNMSDVYIGVLAKEQNIKIYAIDREEYWLKPLNEYNERIYGNNPIEEINKLLKLSRIPQ